MKTLVVYYSRSGITEKAARRTAEALGADIIRVEDVKSRRGAIGFMMAGYEVVCNKLPDIRELSLPHAINEYDLVILCAPIWAGHVSTPIRTFIVKYLHNVKNTAYIITRAGSNDYKNVFDEIDKYIGAERSAAVSLQSKTDFFDKETDRFIDTVKALG